MLHILINSFHVRIYCYFVTGTMGTHHSIGSVIVSIMSNDSILFNSSFGLGSSGMRFHHVVAILYGCASSLKLF